MPTTKDIERKICEIIAEQLGIAEDDISSASAFVEDLGADSLDLVEVVMAVEEEFGLDVPESDADKFEAVSDLVEYIFERVAA